MSESNTSKMTSSEMDAEVTRLLLEKDLATQADVDECIQARKDLAAGGDARNLMQILMDRGVVTSRQMDRLRQMIEASRGRQIPGYQLLAKLGTGAMATVFKGRQVSLNRTVAIKVLPQRFSKDADYVERFYREGEAAAKLNHPNIVQAIDIGEANGYHYFVMEYIEGHTVYDELAGGKIFPEAEALRIAIQMARALDHAHAAGLIHRDVKPKNIMITNDGVAKLADMGLARAVADTQAAQAEAGLLFGTPYYISPEQIIGKQDVDFRADIYALGATLYHMVTGQVPYQADDARGVMMKHLKEPLVSPDKHNLDLSFGICKVIKKMMAKHRKSRHASTAELLRDLESVDFLLEADSPSPDGSSAAGTAAFSPADLEVPKFEAPTSKTVPVPRAKAKPSARAGADARHRAAQPTVPIPPPRAAHAPAFNTVSWILLVAAVVSVLLNVLLLLTR